MRFVIKILFFSIFLLPLSACGEKANTDEALGIETVGAARLERIFRLDGDKARVLFFYSTSCNYCRQQFPGVNSLAPGFAAKGVETYAIAIDANPADVAEFNEAHTYKVELKMHRLYGSEAKEIEEVLKRHGSGFHDNIPYIGIIGADGRIVQEFQGTVTKAALQQAVDGALAIP